MDEVTDEQKRRIEWLFMHHAPSQAQMTQYQALRDAAKVMARAIFTHTLPGADQEAAIRLLRETLMTANASIALEGKK